MSTFHTFLGKILWRVRFALTQSFGMDPKIISYTLFPFIRQQEDFREKVLVDKGFISWNKSENFFTYDSLRFNYKGSLPFGDFVSIFLAEDLYIKKNFLLNPAFRLEGSYEQDQVSLKNGDVVIDAGANIGLFSIFASRKVGSSGKVFAFEPIAETRKILEKNLRENNITNVVVVPHALGNKSEKTMFSVNVKELGASSAVFKDGDTEEEVSTIRLDDFAQENQLRKIDFVKADIEGMERFLLEGAKESIINFKPNLSICLYHLPDDPQVLEGLARSFVPTYKITKSKTKLFASQ